MKTREELVTLGIIERTASQKSLDITRHSFSWHLGYAMGNIPEDHPMHCSIELAFAFLLATRSRKTKHKIDQLKAIKAEALAFIIGWCDSGRTRTECLPGYVDEWINHINWNYDMAKTNVERMN